MNSALQSINYISDEGSITNAVAAYNTLPKSWQWIYVEILSQPFMLISFYLYDLPKRTAVI